MEVFHWILGTLLGVVWLWRFVDAALGMSTLAEISKLEWDIAAGDDAPLVSIIVPARNEEANVEQSLASLLALDYPRYEIIAVNDRSEDRTGEIMARLAQTTGGRLRVVHIQSLPAGWLGKQHAMWCAIKIATGEWLLFTDADVVYRRDTLRRAMAYAEASHAHHVVLFPTLEMCSWSERMMLGFFQLLFVFGHRPWKVADPRARDHMGVGAFNLVQADAYEASGTHEALRMLLIDDMHLGRLIKEHGFAQRNVFGRGLLRLRWAHGAWGVVDNLTKNFFALMSFQWQRSLAAVALLLVLNLGPYLGVFFAPGIAKGGYIVALGSLLALYVGMSALCDIRPLYFFLHPIAALLFAYILLRSAGLALCRQEVEWRGTRYPLGELRKALEEI